MKKYTIIAVLMMASLMTGCVKTEFASVPDKKVTFSVGMYKPGTKTASILDVDGIESFNSKGYLYSEGFMDSYQNFFGAAGEVIYWNETDEEWAPSHPYYWPKGSGSYINFVSWYDKNGTPDSVSETTLAWTIDGTGRVLAADDNIMFADEVWGYKQNDTPATYGYDNVGDGVPTLFHHALAQLCVKVKASKLSDDGVTWTITASNCQVGGLYTAGSISLTTTEPAELPATSQWTGTWTTSGQKRTISGVTASTNITTAGVDMFPMHSIIPQALGTSYLSFTYVVRTQYDANNYIEETAQTGNIRFSSFSNALTSWGMNKRVTYTVIINPENNEILIDPDVTDWLGPVSPSPLSIE